MGFVWSEPMLFGPNSIACRSQWELSPEPSAKHRLVSYNADDCNALEVLTGCLDKLCQAPGITQPLDDAIWVDQLKPPKRFNLINKDGAALPEFKEINRAAYWDYQRQRVYVRSSKTIRKAIEKVGRRKAKYLPAKQPVQHPVPLSCSYCGCADLRRGGTTFVLVHDVRFLHSGVKGYVTRHIWENWYCSQYLRMVPLCNAPRHPVSDVCNISIVLCLEQSWGYSVAGTMTGTAPFFCHT